METNRTTMALIVEEDIPEILEMFREPDTFKFIGKLQNKTDEEYREFLKTKLPRNQVKTNYYWIARLKETGEFVGAVNLNYYNQTDMIQVGVQIKRKFWGQGFAPEVVTRARDFGVTDVGLNLIHGVVEPAHIASKKMLMKSGFKYSETITINNETLEIYKYIVR